MADKKAPGKVERRGENNAPQKPIRLNDLIPTHNVTGGRSVFGSSPAAKPNKPKRQK